MNKLTATIYATTLTNYLSQHLINGFITTDISPYQAVVTFSEISMTDEQIIKLGEKATRYIGGECEMHIKEFEKTRHKYLQYLWQITEKE